MVAVRPVHRNTLNDVAVLIECVALTNAHAAKFNVFADIQLRAVYAENQGVDVSITTLNADRPLKNFAVLRHSRVL